MKISLGQNPNLWMVLVKVYLPGVRTFVSDGWIVQASLVVLPRLKQVWEAILQHVPSFAVYLCRVDHESR